MSVGEPGTQGFPLTSDSPFQSWAVVCTPPSLLEPFLPQLSALPSRDRRAGTGHPWQRAGGTALPHKPGPRLAVPPGLSRAPPAHTSCTSSPTAWGSREATRAEPWRWHNSSHKGHTCSPALTELSQAEAVRVPKGPSNKEGLDSPPSLCKATQPERGNWKRILVWHLAKPR